MVDDERKFLVLEENDAKFKVNVSFPLHKLENFFEEDKTLRITFKNEVYKV